VSGGRNDGKRRGVERTGVGRGKGRKRKRRKEENGNGKRGGGRKGSDPVILQNVVAPMPLVHFTSHGGRLSLSVPASSHKLFFTIKMHKTLHLYLEIQRNFTSLHTPLPTRCSFHFSVSSHSAKADVRHATKLSNFVAQLCFATKFPV